MINDINIVGGTIVTANESVEGAIGIRGEAISFIGFENELLPANRTMDAHGCLVMPGMIDAHVHVRIPSFSYREDFRTATSAAAAGGVTTMVEMPISDPTATDKGQDQFVVRRSGKTRKREKGERDEDEYEREAFCEHDGLHGGRARDDPGDRIRFQADARPWAGSRGVEGQEPGYAVYEAVDEDADIFRDRNDATGRARTVLHAGDNSDLS